MEGRPLCEFLPIGLRILWVSQNLGESQSKGTIAGLRLHDINGVLTLVNPRDNALPIPVWQTATEDD